MHHDSSEIKISVVIPVYNAEPYISRCIESLKAQTLAELEFIFVDDLGQDKSMDFVYKWASIDSRVIILQNEHNAGEGASRNRGIKAAKGFYINTMDPDDWCAPDYFELLWNKAVKTSADIVKGTRIKINDVTHEEVKPRSNLNAIINASLAKGEPLFLRLHYEHQTIIFKRTLIDGYVKYGKSANAADTTFLLKLCSKAESFAAENKACYYYLQRRTSATGEFSLKRSLNELVSFEEIVEHFLQKGHFGKYEYKFCHILFKVCILRFIYACEAGDVSAEQKKQYISDFKKVLIRIPGYENLYKLNPRIMALIELDLVTMERLSSVIATAKDEVSDWVTYLTALDGKEKTIACEKLGRLLVSYVKKRKKDGAALRVISLEILQIGADLKGTKNKIIYYSIIINAFIKNFPRH